jgi:hypothetical protein
VDLEPTVRFAISGQESTQPGTKLPFDPFSPSSSDGIAWFLGQHDYCRIMWWPQPQVDKWVMWTADRMPLPDPFVPNPYRELGDSDEDPATWPSNLGTLVGNIASALVKHWLKLMELFAENLHLLSKEVVEFVRLTVAAYEKEGKEGVEKVLTNAFSGELQEVGVDLYFTLLGNRVSNDFAKTLFNEIFGGEQAWEQTWSPMIMNGIFLVEDDLKKVPGPQTFQDYGDTGLPMDDEISDLLMPTEFTELWIPMSKAAATMQSLQAYYQQGYAATGTYACELYAAMPSEFWMSPAYSTTGEPVLRVDVFFFGRNGDQTAPEFYGPLWDWLRKASIPFRPHWGKYLPPVSSYGPSYYGQVYPKLGDFLAKRGVYDPKQLFVTDYWRNQLGIAKP